jgi:hypothetical protein
MNHANRDLELAVTREITFANICRMLTKLNWPKMGRHELKKGQKQTLIIRSVHP